MPSARPLGFLPGDGRYRTSVTRIMTADPDAAWAAIACFHAAERWLHPAVTRCRGAGRRRILRLAEGPEIEEELESVHRGERLLRSRVRRHGAPAGPIAIRVAVQPFHTGAAISCSAAFDSHRPERVRNVARAMFCWAISSLEARLGDVS